MYRLNGEEECVLYYVHACRLGWSLEFIKVISWTNIMCLSKGMVQCPLHFTKFNGFDITRMILKHCEHKTSITKQYFF